MKLKCDEQIISQIYVNKSNSHILIKRFGVKEALNGF